MYKKPLINLRKATIDDLETLKFWDTQEHVIQSDPNDDWNWEIELQKEPDWREQLVAEIDGEPLGFIQIIDPALEETHYWGDCPENLRAIDIWIGNIENTGKGYGTEMMTQAIERCFVRPEVTAILIDPLETNTRAHNFYKKFGFEFVEKRQFGTDACFVFQLNRETWENHSK